MDIQRILWPTDFSENAVKALPLVTSLAEKYGAEIHILYVLKEYLEFGACYGGCDPQADGEEMRRWEKETAEKRLDKLCEEFLSACPLYIRHLSVGDPIKESLDLIASEGIDMVIMANKSQEDHYDFSALADRVLDSNELPVVLVPV